MATKNETQNEKPVQSGLFQDKTSDQSAKIDFPTVDDVERENLLVSLMALESIRGIGFKTLRALFDAGFLHHLPQWDAAETARQWSLLSGQHRVDLDKAIFSKKEKRILRGKRIEGLMSGTESAKYPDLARGGLNFKQALKEPPDSEQQDLL